MLVAPAATRLLCSEPMKPEARRDVLAPVEEIGKIKKGLDAHVDLLEDLARSAAAASEQQGEADLARVSRGVEQALAQAHAIREHVQVARELAEDLEGHAAKQQAFNEQVARFLEMQEQKIALGGLRHDVAVDAGPGEAVERHGLLLQFVQWFIRAGFGAPLDKLTQIWLVVADILGTPPASVLEHMRLAYGRSAGDGREHVRDASSEGTSTPAVSGSRRDLDEKAAGSERAKAPSDAARQAVPSSEPSDPGGARNDVNDELEPDKEFEDFLAERTRALAESRRRTVVLLARASYYGELILERLYPEDAASPPDITYPEEAPGFVRPNYDVEDITASEDLCSEFIDAHWDRFERYRRLALRIEGLAGK